jgi:hypothetical protein
MEKRQQIEVTPRCADVEEEKSREDWHQDAQVWRGKRDFRKEC